MKTLVKTNVRRGQKLLKVVFDESAFKEPNILFTNYRVRFIGGWYATQMYNKRLLK